MQHSSELMIGLIMVKKEYLLWLQLGIHYFAAFVNREPARRNISLPKANRREDNHYVKVIKKDQPGDGDDWRRSVYSQRQLNQILMPFRLKMSTMTPHSGAARVVQSWRAGRSWFQSDTVLKLLTISGLLELADRLASMLY